MLFNCCAVACTSIPKPSRIETYILFGSSFGQFVFHVQFTAETQSDRLTGWNMCLDYQTGALVYCPMLSTTLNSGTVERKTIRVAFGSLFLSPVAFLIVQHSIAIHCTLPESTLQVGQQIWHTPKGAAAHLQRLFNCDRNEKKSKGRYRVVHKTRFLLFFSVCSPNSPLDGLLMDRLSGRHVRINVSMPWPNHFTGAKCHCQE